MFCDFGEALRTYSDVAYTDTNVVTVPVWGRLVALVAGGQVKCAGFHFSPKAYLLVLLPDQYGQVQYHASQLGRVRHSLLSLDSFAQR